MKTYSVRMGSAAYWTVESLQLRTAPNSWEDYTQGGWIEYDLPPNTPPDLRVQVGTGVLALNEWLITDDDVVCIVESEATNLAPPKLEEVFSFQHIREQLEGADPLDRQEWLGKLGDELAKYCPEATDALHSLGRYR